MASNDGGGDCAVSSEKYWPLVRLCRRRGDIALHVVKHSSDEGRVDIEQMDSNDGDMFERTYRTGGTGLWMNVSVNRATGIRELRVVWNLKDKIIVHHPLVNNEQQRMTIYMFKQSALLISYQPLLGLLNDHIELTFTANPKTKQSAQDACLEFERAIGNAVPVVRDPAVKPVERVYSSRQSLASLGSGTASTSSAGAGNAMGSEYTLAEVLAPDIAELREEAGSEAKYKKMCDEAMRLVKQRQTAVEKRKSKSQRETVTSDDYFYEWPVDTYSIRAMDKRKFCTFVADGLQLNMKRVPVWIQHDNAYRTKLALALHRDPLELHIVMNSIIKETNKKIRTPVLKWELEPLNVKFKPKIFIHSTIMVSIARLTSDDNFEEVRLRFAIGKTFHTRLDACMHFVDSVKAVCEVKKFNVADGNDTYCSNGDQDHDFEDDEDSETEDS